jgi:hypothetical protein
VTRRWKIIVALVAWVVAVTIHGWLYVEHYTQAARAAHIEEYAYTRSFQLVAFLFLRLPCWIVGPVLIWLVSAAVKRRQQRSAS